MNITDQIIDYECGNIDEAGTLQLFAKLIESGTAWTLQGSYGRTAKSLIEAGYISEDGKHIFYQDIVQ